MNNNYERNFEDNYLN